VALVLFRCAGLGLQVQRKVGGAPQRAAPEKAAPAKCPHSAKGAAAPASSKLSKVRTTCRPSRCRRSWDRRSGQASYPSAKTFNPYNFGNDSGNRVEYKYKGQGRVVFAVPKWGGNMKVVRVDYDPPKTATELRSPPPDDHTAHPRRGEDASREAIPLGLASLSVADVVAVARDGARLELERDPAYRARLEAGGARSRAHCAKGVAVYGVTTGVRGVAGTRDRRAERKLVTQNLLRFHGCGTGRILDGEESAAVVVARLASLARGYSGVRPVVLERLCELVNRRILPRIPEEGSVGASGDLTPLSYVAALLVGEREALVAGEWWKPQTRSRARARAARARAQGEPRADERHERDDRARVSRDRARGAARALGVHAHRDDGARDRGQPAPLRSRDLRAEAAPGHAARGAWIREDLEPVAALRPRGSRTSTRCAARRT
jgi:hypothetical protein